MKDIKKIKKISKEFFIEFGSAIKAVGNNLSVGIGKDEDYDDYIIVANLSNGKLKSILPSSYKGIKVSVKIVGVIEAL